MNEKVDIITWSQCGDYTAILNVNSEVRISPTSSTSKGLMTVSQRTQVMPRLGGFFVSQDQ